MRYTIATETVEINMYIYIFSRFKLSTQGIRVQREIYEEAMERINFNSDLFRQTQVIPSIGAFFCPYVWVIYQWAIGEYTIDKWFYLFKIW